MTLRVLIPVLLASTWLVSCRSSKGTSETSAPGPPAVAYSSVTDDQRPFILAQQFCLDTPTPLITWKLPAPQVFEMKLYNRWGNEIMTINNPHITPLYYFTVPPEAMTNAGVVFYTLKYVQLNGETITWSGYLNFMGPDCQE